MAQEPAALRPAASPRLTLGTASTLLLLRYGGLRAHRRALPLFLGLLAGSAAVRLLQAIVFRALGLRP